MKSEYSGREVLEGKLTRQREQQVKSSQDKEELKGERGDKLGAPARARPRRDLKPW